MKASRRGFLGALAALAFKPDAFAFEPTPVSVQSVVLNDKPFRFDVLYGAAIIKPQHAIRLTSEAEGIDLGSRGILRFSDEVIDMVGDSIGEVFSGE